MHKTSYGSPFAREEIDLRASRYVTGVYVWMAMGVALSAAVGWALVSSGLIFSMLRVARRGFIWGVFIIQMGAVLGFSGSVARMNVNAARALYFVYAAVVGVTLSLVSLVYTFESIVAIFGLAVMAYVGLATFGSLTKKNLGPVGTFCGMGLFMVFGLSILYALAATFGVMSAWMESLNMTIGIAGIVVFSGLTAWESQRVREQAGVLARADASGAHINTYTVQGAFTMYMNFINLFFSLLRVFGSRR